ncbi:MAG: hypothetical protein DWI57_02740 [Chloroflexi bacterium]|nr:MAG: hypothetical protein DWI57_02740 [Chloroflexota bacterium]
MPGYLLTMSCVVTCAHGGQAKAVAPNPRVKVMGTPVPMAAAPFVVAGCPMVIPPPAGPGPTPCITASFLPPTATARVKSMGQPLLCQSSSTGPCVTTPPSPPAPLLPVSSAGQARVKGQ